MTRSRTQSVADADRDLRQYLIRIAATLGEVLNDGLVGLYVHGSLASGSYRRECSDVDLIAVVSRRLAPREREILAWALVGLSDARPVWGDIEISIVQERCARAFEHPMPYEAHYSSALHEAIRRGRIDFSRDESDPDLAAHVVDLRERGVALVGPPPASLFGPVPWYAYVNALEADFAWCGQRIASAPVNVVLNACRTLHGATSSAMRSLNKDEAGSWALKSVPGRHHSTINDALAVYRGIKSADDVVFHASEIAALREYVHDRAKPAFARASDSGEEE